MSFNRLSLVQLIIFIFHYDSVWVPLVTTALSIFKSILAFAGAEMPAYGFHLPLQGVFLPLSGRKPMGAHVGVQMLLESICLRSPFTLIVLVSPCFHACFSRELGFIYTNMFLHWQLSQHESHISCWHLIQPLPSSLRWWPQKPPHSCGLLTAVKWLLLS